MKRLIFLSLLICSVCGFERAATAAPKEFSFAVIAHSFRTEPDESALRDAISETDEDNLAFVVANGIKASSEPCTDKIYNQRKALLDDAKNGLILSLAASDWAGCKTENGKSAAMERLNRLRDLFFADEFSFGASRIPLVRQSTTPKFRSYRENARWEIGSIMFATINLPANNNHYLPEAGRNSEFEDRLIANRNWLQRIFIFATRKKLDGIVLFSDADPLFTPDAGSLGKLSGKRDGFTETRRQIIALASRFPGKVLIIHGQTGTGASARDGIVWHNNLGVLDAESGWVKLTANPSASSLFAVTSSPAEAKNTRQ